MWPPADTDLDTLEIVALAEDDGVVTATDGDRRPASGAEPRETTPDEAWPWLQVDDLEALEQFAWESSTPARPDPIVPQDDGGRSTSVSVGDLATRDPAGDGQSSPAIVHRSERPSPSESGVGPSEHPAAATTVESPPRRGARIFDDAVAPSEAEREAARALRIAIAGAAVILALASAWAAGWIDPAGWIGVW